MSFKAVQQGIEQKEGVSPKAAGAILASSSRNASPAAKKANPALKKVAGAPKASKPAAPKKAAPAKNQPAWAGIANQMLGNVPATGNGSPMAGNGNR